MSAAMVNDVWETEGDARTCTECYPGGFFLGEWGIE